MKFYKKCFVILTMVLVFFMTPTIFADDNEDNQQTFVTNFQSDTTLTGDVSSQTIYFRTLDYWDVDEVQLNLEYQVSQLAEDEYSDLTFTINGTKFYSMDLTAKEDTQTTQVKIPKDLLVKDTNTLVIQGNVTTKDNENYCSIPDTPADWLSIFKTSHIDVRYHSQEMKKSIQVFHARFSGMDSIKNKQVAILTADKADVNEMESATYILSSYAKLKNDTEETIPLSQLSDADNNQKEYQIIVGMYNNLPDNLQKEISKKDLEKGAQIKLITAGNKKILLLTATNDKELIKGARFVANTQLMSEVSSSEKIVDDKTDTKTPKKEVDQDFQLNAQGQKLTGAFHQEAQFFASLPAARVLTSDSQVNLHFRYSENLDFDRSLVTILINDVPIGSQKLTKDKANNDTVSINVPKNIDVGGKFTLTIAFDLEIQDLPCTIRQEQMPWAYITPESKMTIQTAAQTDLSFDNYPYPFIMDGKYNDTAIVLPEKIDNSSYQSISALINYLGSYIEDNQGTLLYVKTDKEPSDETLEKNNLIILGSYKNNRVIKNLNSNLYLQYNDNGKYFVSNDKLSIEEQYGSEIGTGQLLASPYSENKAVLALTSATSDGVTLAAKGLANQDAVNQHTGDVFTVDSEGIMNELSFTNNESKEKETKTKSGNETWLLVLFIGLGVIIAAALIGYFKLKAKKEK